MNLMSEWLKSVSPNVVGYGSVAAIGVMALIAFRVARRIVQLGYFVLYFFIGFGIVYAACVYSTRDLQVPLSMPIIGGLGFAATASFVRAKLMRFVAAAMLVALISIGGKFWSQYAGAHAPGGDKGAQGDTLRIANEGLAAAKRDFDDIVGMLPKKNGKIAPGWISPDALEKAGVDEPLEKVSQEPAWHTWLTGLYKQEKEDLGIWTPGGTPAQAKRGLELKPKK
jgi:hypothetical protein